MSDKTKLSIAESSDFYLLLELMLPLYKEERYSCLPELFSVIGHEKLITLCKYLGGTTIKIPTIDELNFSIEALDWYYKVYISRCKYRKSIPSEYVEEVEKIREILNANNNKAVHK